MEDDQMDFEEENLSDDNSIIFGKENFIGKIEGPILDDYTVIRRLGEGGYGKVYEIKSKKTGEIRACKHLSKISIANLEKFEREINILIKTDHPHIIKLYDVYESERSLYLVMEQCKGGEVFHKIMERVRLKKMYTEQDAANIFQQLMSSVEYCHNNGICHRDLKPENLLYLNKGDEKDNPIRVIDFGLSQIFIGRKLKTKVGTIYYIAPEVIKGKYNEKCDIWSAGVILYMFLSGDSPFCGYNNAVILSKILKMKYSFPDEKWKHISNEAKDLIRHMLTAENERYNAKQVLAHPWLKNASNIPLIDLNFDPIFFNDYLNCSYLKKMFLIFIASRIDENEILDLKKIFEAFNLSKDGQITIDELEIGLKKLKYTPADRNQLVNLFNNIDVDKNRRIDYTEFLAATLPKEKYLKKERLLEAFCAFNKDNNGNITKNAIMEILRVDKSREKEIELYIKDADKNQDGVIDFEEFLNFMGYDDNDNKDKQG